MAGLPFAQNGSRATPAAAAYASRPGGHYNIYDESCYTFACEMLAACAVDASSPRRSGVFNCSRTLMYNGRPPFADAGYGLRPTPWPSVNQTTPSAGGSVASRVMRDVTDGVNELLNDLPLDKLRNDVHNIGRLLGGAPRDRGFRR